MGDLNKRRGRVLGMNSVEDQGMTFISAEVPLWKWQIMHCSCGR
ncbi:MAG: hypothetical protein ACLT3Y_06725 [Ruminococcus callidus]